MNHISTITTGSPLSRRRFLQAIGGLGLSAAGLGLLEACGSQPFAPSTEKETLETTTIRLVQFPGICVAPLYVAEDLLKSEGFTDVQYIKIEGNIEYVASGEIDIDIEYGVQSIIWVDAKKPIVILAGVHVGCFELFGLDRVETIRDLKGKTIPVSELGYVQQAFLSSMLAYVGLDPNTDINWVVHPPAEAIQFLAEGKVDAYLAVPPAAQELRAKKIGHVVLNSMMDEPWSQYFCCTAIANREFAQKNPTATKRALRAILKAADICAREPERAARFMVDRGFTKNYDYALDAMKHIPYNKWREYDPEDTLRFWALRLRDAGMIKSSPDEIIAQGADWRFFNELKTEEGIDIQKGGHHESHLNHDNG